MKKKANKPRLLVTRETIGVLDNIYITKVKGGGGPFSGASSCLVECEPHPTL